MLDIDARVRLAIQHQFIAALPTPDVASVAATLDAAVGDVAAAFDRLAVGRAIVLAPTSRDIVMSAPFAAGATDFVVHVAERRYYANCIWDALGISVMLAGADQPRDAEVRTSCADCGELLTILVRDGVARALPGDAVAHFAVPAARWWADIGFT